MTARASRIRKYMFCFQKMCSFGKNSDIIEKKIGKKLIFYIAIFNFLWHHWIRNKVSCQ